MFLKKVLNQPNLVGSMLIALMICGGFVYAVGFDGFSVETATSGEVEAWLEAASGSGSSNNYTCDDDGCKGYGDRGKQYANCPARKGIGNCTDCSKVSIYCNKSRPKCSKSHGHCRNADNPMCLYAPQRGGCSNAINPRTKKTQSGCIKSCRDKNKG